MTLLIAPIVEGKTEVRCIERLLQRVWVEVLGQVERLQVVRPIWAKRDQVVRRQGTELADGVEQAARVVAAAAVRAGPDGRCLILLFIDAESACPATLAPRLLGVARSARSDIDIDCVLPKQMLENWFVASLVSLRAVGVVPPGLPPPADPEDCHGANWLDAQIRAGGRGLAYKKPADAMKFVPHLDLAACHAGSRSFRKLCRVLAARIPPAPPPNPDASGS